MARPRSVQAHEAVLHTTLDLIAERGIEGTSMDAISHASGVSKATVYKHWANKEELCLEAIGRLGGDIPEFDTGDTRTDITDLLRSLADQRRPEIWARIWPRIMGYAACNPDFARQVKLHTSEPRRTQLRQLLTQAISNHELRADIDPDLAIDLLLGPIVHRRFMDLPIPPGFPEYIVQTFWTTHER